MMEMDDYSREGPGPDYNNQGYIPDQNSPPQAVYPSAHAGYYPSSSSAGAAPSPSYDQGYPPSYGQGYQQPQRPVVEVQPAKLVMQQNPQNPPNTYIILAIITMFFNPFIGAFALWFSIMSHRNTERGNYKKGYKRGKEAMWISVGAILCSFVILFTTLIIIYTNGLVQWRGDVYIQTFNNDANNNL